MAETLRTRMTEPDPTAGRQEPGNPPVEREHDRPDQECDRTHEDVFSDSWRTYRERAERIRRSYGWTVPKAA